MLIMNQLILLGLLSLVLTWRQKITKATFFPNDYCSLLSQDSIYKLVITLNQAIDSDNSLSKYPIQVCLIHQKDSELSEDIKSTAICEFESETGEKIICSLSMSSNVFTLQSTSMYLNTLTISNEKINFQNQAYNVSLKLNSHYIKYQSTDAFQVIDFSKVKSNFFYITFTRPVDLRTTPNIASIMLTNAMGNKINVTEFCYSGTLDPLEPSNKLLCALNPRINNLTNTYYSIQYTDICGYQINTTITIQIRGVVIEYTENKTEGREEDELVNHCPLSQYLYIKTCYDKCPLNTFYYNQTRQCLGKCYFKQLVQENESCVKHCSKGYQKTNDYDYDQEMVQRCVRCKSGYSLFETCYDLCPFGSKVDRMGLSCQIGTDSRYEEEYFGDEHEHEDEEEANKPIESCDEYDPCESTGRCVIENNGKVCACDDNYYGFYCEISEEGIPKAMEIINSLLYVPQSNFIIDVSKPSTKVQIPLINHLINQKDNFINENLDFALNIFKGTVNTLRLENRILQSLSKAPQDIGKLVNLSLKILLSMLNSSIRKRHLVADDSSTSSKEINGTNVIQQINNIIDLFDKYLLTHMRTIIAESMTLEYSKNELISFMIWTDKKKSRNKARKAATNKGLSFGDFSICRPLITDNKINTYLSLELSPSIVSIIKDLTEFDTSLIYIKGMSYHGSIIDLSHCPNIPISFPIKDSAWSKLNIDKYTQLKTIGIDIYDAYEPAVNSRCFVTPKYEHDLSQEFRQHSIYANNTFTSAINNKCVYKELNIKAKAVLMLCGYHSEGFIGLYAKNQLTTSFDKGNIPIKCGRNIETNLMTNGAFWIFICSLLMFIFIQLIINVYANKGIYIDDTHNENEKDASINSWDTMDKTTDSLEKCEEEPNKEVSTNQKPIRAIRKQRYRHIFLRTLQRNILLHHPLVNIFVPSIMCPTHFKLAIFFFNLIASFGFNALYFDEVYIEMRMINSNRNSFIYAMSHEGVKILLTLVSLFIITIIIKLISFVPRKLQENTRKRIKGTIFSDERLSIYTDLIHQRMLRDSASYSFMLIILGFLFYYSISFCSNYPNSTIGWIYSSIWTMILIWSIIAPLYITLLSALGCISYLERCLYSMEKLYFF